jgi:hypothetical protein
LAITEAGTIRHTANALHRKFKIYISRNETAWPCSQFVHSCTVSVIDLYIPTMGPQTQYSKIDGPIIGMYKSLIFTYMNVEIGNEAAHFHFLGIFDSNFRYSALSRLNMPGKNTFEHCTVRYMQVLKIKQTKIRRKNEKMCTQMIKQFRRSAR